MDRIRQHTSTHLVYLIPVADPDVRAAVADGDADGLRHAVYEYVISSTALHAYAIAIAPPRSPN